MDESLPVVRFGQLTTSNYLPKECPVMKVIGVGFGRSGTLSLKTALNQLAQAHASICST